MLVKTQLRQDATRVGRVQLTRRMVVGCGQQEDLASLISTIFISSYLHMTEFTGILLQQNEIWDLKQELDGIKSVLIDIQDMLRRLGLDDIDAKSGALICS